MNVTYEEREIHRCNDEIDFLRRLLRPAMILTADDRLDIQRRITENAGWLDRWKQRASRVAMGSR